MAKAKKNNIGVTDTTSGEFSGSAEGTIKTTKKRTGMEEFIRAFQSSNSRKEVATKLGMAVSNVYTREKAYRKSNINLKDMARASSNKLNVDAANAIIAEMANNS